MVDRSNPFEDIERFFERMNRSFGDVPMAPGLHDVAVDVAETDDEIVVTADLPGFEREEITISLSGRDLTIEAEREEHAEETDEDEGGEVRYVRRERSHRQLSRTVRLPAAVVEDSATAEYRNGVLTVTLPRETAETDDDSHTIDID
ncbi:archaeal heat shock protein Hsp14 [Salinigranum sp. GCM10025319]|uniref:archaeal heat shock protein Hsp14 n=1 Tax=Salinigranum sp. GCM10025319 TaxID=3252687 RepID=UPI0036064B40